MLIRLLLLEDDPDFAELVKIRLTQNDVPIQFELHWETTLAGAVSYLIKDKVDLMIVDLGLPDTTGPETVTKLKSVAGDIPIVVLSAENDEETMWEVMCNGAKDHLVKSEVTSGTLPIAVLGALLRHFERLPERMWCLSKASGS